MSQAELAEKADLSVHAVWEMEVNGNGTLTTLEALAKVVDLRFAGLPAGSSLHGRIVRLRQRRGLSVTEAAARAGVSPGAVRRLEQGTARVATLRAVLEALGGSVRVRKPERTLFAGGGRDERFTPPEMCRRVEAVLGSIALGPCGHPDSPVRAERVFLKNHDGLAKEWEARSVYCNPPFSLAAEFLRKGFNEWRAGRAQTVLILLPSRTDRRVYHRCMFGVADVLFLDRTLKYVRPDGHEATIPYGTLLALFGGSEQQVWELTRQFTGALFRRSGSVANNG